MAGLGPPPVRDKMRSGSCAIRRSLKGPSPPFIKGAVPPNTTSKFFEGKQTHCSTQLIHHFTATAGDFTAKAGENTIMTTVQLGGGACLTPEVAVVIMGSRPFPESEPPCTSKSQVVRPIHGPGACDPPFRDSTHEGAVLVVARCSSSPKESTPT